MWSYYVNFTFIVRINFCEVLLNCAELCNRVCKIAAFRAELAVGLVAEDGLVLGADAATPTRPASSHGGCAVRGTKYAQLGGSYPEKMKCE